MLASVKPSKRGDQFKALAALYYLSSDEKPTSAAEINQLIRLHDPRGVPSNTSATLRRCQGLVTPIPDGRLLRWSLTRDGIAHLEHLSGLSLSHNDPLDGFDIDIGIVCALEHPELMAVMTAAGGCAQWHEIGDARYPHLYRETRLPIKSGTDLRVVATTSTSMGLTSAAIATTHLIFRFRPRLVCMIGIAAGTRSSDKEFGDILVADPSVDYNSGKVSEQNGIREFLPDPYPIGLNPRLRILLHKYRGNHGIFQAIRSKWPATPPRKMNRLHLGPVGAADQVIDDPQRVIEIQRNWRKLIGVEMETYAVYRACYEAPEPKPRFISFKSVCDFAAEKSDSWQPYAAFTAAEFSLAFLTDEWDAMWHT